MGLGGQVISLVAARGRSVLAVADVTVWRSRDSGASFDVAAVLTSPAHALVLAADGDTALLADEEGIVELGARGLRRRLEGRVDALASCGADVVALAEDGVHRLDAGDLDQRLGARPPVRALTCGGDGIVAVGVGLWTSDDGAAWVEAATGLGRSFTEVAVAAGRAWLAGADALFVLDSVPESVEDGAAVAQIIVAGAVRPAPRDAYDGRHPPSWAGLLPRIAIAFDQWTESTGVAGWRLWLRVTVSLGRRWQRSTTENLEDLR